MKAVKVKKEFGEDVRKEIEKLGLKDRKRRIRFENGFVVIPVVSDFDPILISKFSDYCEIVEDQNPVFVKRKNFREIVKEIAGFYPKFADLKIFGDVGVLKLPPSISGYKKIIGREVARAYRLNSVWLDKGRAGMERTPDMEALVGNKSEIELKENGCIFRFDLTKVMFSQGNQYEKIRIAKLVEEEEIILDMFAGIGYFTIPIMKHSRAKKCYAIEINPISYEYLIENIKLNDLENVVPVLGDSMKVSPENFADRVIMGHIRCEDFIKTAIEALRGEGWIHYHEAVPVKILERPINRITKEAESLNAKVTDISMRKVKNYSPNVYHVVVDARIRKIS